MSKEERKLLEEIAIEMLVLSMEYIGEDDEIVEETRSATDEELINYICG